MRKEKNCQQKQYERKKKEHTKKKNERQNAYFKAIRKQQAVARKDL